jgi:alpha-1,2-mannosyltransferase
MAASFTRPTFVPDWSQSGQRDGWLATGWGWLAVAVSLSIAAVNDWGWMVGRREIDFNVYIMGAHHLTSASLYIDRLTSGPHLPFTYPPFAALAFWPLAQLPLKVATVVWGGINLLALLVIVAATLRVLRPRRTASGVAAPWRLALVLLGPAALLEPVMLNMSFGQVNIVLTALVMIDVTGRLRVGQRTWPRGVLVGLAAAMKLTPLIFVAYFVVTKQWRAVRTALATFLVSSCVPVLFNPHTSLRFWTFYIHDVSRIGGAAYVSNQSALGAIDRLSHHVWNPSRFLVLEALLLALGLVAAWRLARRGQGYFGFLATAVTGLLVSPITWCHHMIIVAAVAAWLWWGEYRDRGGRVGAVATLGLFYWAPMWHVPHDGHRDLEEHGWALVAGNSFFFATVIFLIFALWSAARMTAHQQFGENKAQH